MSKAKSSSEGPKPRLSITLDALINKNSIREETNEEDDESSEITDSEFCEEPLAPERGGLHRLYSQFSSSNR